MDTEDARGAEATIHATKLYVVEDPRVLPTAVATFWFRGSGGVEGGDTGNGGDRRSC